METELNIGIYHVHPQWKEAHILIIFCVFRAARSRLKFQLKVFQKNHLVNFKFPIGFSIEVDKEVVEIIGEVSKNPSSKLGIKSFFHREGEFVYSLVEGSMGANKLLIN